MGLDELKQRLAAVRRGFEEAQRGIAPKDFAWYPYDTWSSVLLALEMVAGSERAVETLKAGRPALDIGCGDGGLSFFLESLGSSPVVAVDCAATNYNRMHGVQALQRAFGSHVDIQSLDIDGRFELPRHHYGIAWMLGVLYHLKNPFYILEQLAAQADYLVLSTRLVRRLPGMEAAIDQQSVAYLVSGTELNSDPTNFWLFTEAGLRRLCERAGWQVVVLRYPDETRAGDVASIGGDLRCFCLLESRRNDPLSRATPVEGWHELEDGWWRWAGRRFSARVAAQSPGSAARFRFEYTTTEHLHSRCGEVGLKVSANGAAVAERTMVGPGTNSLECTLAPLEAGETEYLIECELTDAIPADESDERERGVIVTVFRVE